MKKLLLLSSILMLSVTTIFGTNKQCFVAKAKEETILPSSITSSIYRYANVIEDTPSNVDNALLDWLYATDNLSGLPFFETDPVEYTATINRQTKDNFYVLAYIQQYIANGNIDCKAPVDLLSMSFGKIISIKENLFSFIDYELENNYEGAYNDCKVVYECLKDTCLCIENDHYFVYYKPLETFISNAKTYLQNQIDNIKAVGFDASLNQYSTYMSTLNGFGLLTKQKTSSSDKHNKDLLDYILFNENTHIDTYNSKEFLDFTAQDYDDAISGIPYGDYEEVERVSAPYLEKMERQLLTCLITFNFVSSYINDIDSFKAMVNNYAPLLYKALDIFYAICDNDSANIMFESFMTLDDYDMLLGILDLTTNKQDLKYEKFLANIRLGSLVYKNTDPYKFSKYLSYVDKINKVSLTGSTYEECVEKINNLVIEGYKHINVDLIPSSDQATLFFVNGLENLASREQGYDFEIRRMLNQDYAFPIESKMQDDYGDNMLYTNIIWIDMALTDKNTKHELAYVDNVIDVTFGIYNFEINTDIRIYRYDEGNDKVVSLSNEVTESGSDYFDLSVDNVTVHTKDFGTFAIAYINRLIKEEVENFRNDLTTLQNQINLLNAELASKNDTISQLQNKVTQLEGRITTLENDVTVKDETIASLQTELNQTKTLLNDKIVEIDNLNSTVNTQRTLSIIFIVLTCVFAVTSIALMAFYLFKKKKESNNQ